MIKNVILTLIYGKYEFDMEFPAEATLGQIRPLLVQALQKKGIVITEPFKLSNNHHFLDDSETFLKSGLWDGSYLELTCGGNDDDLFH